MPADLATVTPTVNPGRTVSRRSEQRAQAVTTSHPTVLIFPAVQNCTTGETATVDRTRWRLG